MKKVCTIAFLSATAITSHAQTSVTMYGRINADIEYIQGLPSSAGGTSRWKMGSANAANSYWGIRGSEDIGSGIKIAFRLESDFNTQNGGLTFPTQIFSRWATIGASNPQWGTLLAGRQFAIPNNVWDFDPFKQTVWSSASLVHGRNWPFTNNSISYQSPNIAGFDVYGQYSLSNATSWNGNGTTSQGRGDGIQLTYTSALFQVRGIYDEIRNPQNGALDDVYQFSREYFIGANVFLGSVKLSAAYQTSHASQVVPAAPTVTRLGWAGLTWQATSAAQLQAAVYHVNANAGSGNATLYALGGTYNLSKRTSFYTEFATARNSSSGTFGLEALPVGNPDAPLPGHSQSGFFAGITHYF
ncbi:porin [Paraburkholderia sp. LEh10]|uniref:porin n=1 Tax=Paraburkholderia sp. LEh10 TaxID=2821353 RepID=UPI001AEA366B|nr:porin [Paraburkholderia sp. LEh10]MBP0594908.1 porin [Paraburkholderia sp. LEh10]